MVIEAQGVSTNHWVLRTETTSGHHRVPLLAALRRYQASEMVPFSTPGHKLGAGADPELLSLLGAEVFAHDVWLNTGDHERVLREAETLAADAWGAERTRFLVNGSTGGNHAFLLAILRPGDEVVIGRDVHKSLLVALMLTGARPIFVSPDLHPELHVSVGLNPAGVAAALDAHPAARLVVLVSPTYWGIVTDIAGIADVAHARGVPLYVDEAWGPHFPFHPRLPLSALASSADGAVTSPHKLLGCLGQGAMLHTRGPRIDHERVAAAVQMTGTTSPSLPILASLDACRRQMVLQGEALLDQTLALAADARDRLAAIPGLRVLTADDVGGAALDPTRLVVDVTDIGMSGCAVERLLRDCHGVAPEMSDLVGLVFLLTIGDTPRSVDRLVDALGAIAVDQRQKRPHPIEGLMRSSGDAVAPGEQALTPREAYFAPTRTVRMSDSVGKVAAEPVIPYPPGLAVLVPGEVVTAAKVAYLARGAAYGMYVTGPVDSTLATLRVVA